MSKVTTSFELYKDLAINPMTGWVEFEGEVVSVDELSNQTILEPSDIMQIAKSKENFLRLLTLDEAAGRKFTEKG
jgi:hypothetical protein